MGEVKKGKETQVREQIPQRLLHAYADLAGMAFENILDDARDLWFGQSVLLVITWMCV